MSIRQTRSITLPGGLDLSGIPTFSHAQGAYVFDSEGNSYLDMISGYGTVIAGHAHELVIKKINETLLNGNYLYGNHDLISHLKERLTSLFPVTTDALFFKTGSEAVQCATRLARAATGRDRILRCGFHGWHDQFMTENISWHTLGETPTSKGGIAGVPSGLAPFMTRVSLEEQVLDQELSKGDVAALILDPVQLEPPLKETLAKVQNKCSARDVLLIIDESKTGFRISPGGVQGKLDLFGDITILSKALANGFPLAAVLTSRDLRLPAASTKIMGTYNDELTAIAAAHATLDIILEKKAWQVLNDLGDWLLGRVNDELKSTNCKAFALVGFRWPSMPALIHLGSPESSRELLAIVAQRLLQRRILWLPRHMNFLSLAHTREMLDEFATALVAVCSEVNRAGS